MEDVTVWGWLRSAQPSLLGPPVDLEPQNNTSRSTGLDIDGGARGDGPPVCCSLQATEGSGGSEDLIDDSSKGPAA